MIAGVAAFVPPTRVLFCYKEAGAATSPTPIGRAIRTQNEADIHFPRKEDTSTTYKSKLVTIAVDEIHAGHPMRLLAAAGSTALHGE
jgi:hypothetical protein